MTNPASSSSIAVDTLPVIAYQNVRVLTTELLAQLYGTDPENLRNNFLRNQDRFTAEKHYFKLQGEELKKFKQLHKPSSGGLVDISPRTKHLTLWTERGAARHAKILDTDAAWDVFEQLENAYFNPRETAQSAPSFDIPQTLHEALRLAADLAESGAKQQARLALAEPKADALDRIATASDGAFNLTNAAKTLQVGPKALIQLLSQDRWIYRRAGGKNWVAYQDKLQQGVLEHKITKVLDADGADHIFEQVLVTAKGLAKLAVTLRPITGIATAKASKASKPAAPSVH